MKIDGNNEIARSAFADKTSSKEAAQDAEFKDILKSTVERVTPLPAENQAPPLNPVSAIRSPALTPEARHTTIERVDILLNLLDHYRNQLANPQVTLRSIEPVVNTIAKEKEQLSAVLDVLPQHDALKDIVNRTLITASLEVIKYNRGDYISA